MNCYFCEEKINQLIVDVVDDKIVCGQCFESFEYIETENGFVTCNGKDQIV